MILKKIICWVLVVACMTAIFCFSSETATESSQTSASVTEKVLETVSPSFRKLSAEKKQQTVEKVQFSVRKLAHFSIYCALGFFLYLALNNYRLKLKWLLALSISVLYSISDEIHQSFVPGRSCELRDVCIDSSGALAGIFVCMLLTYLIYKYKTAKK